MEGCNTGKEEKDREVSTAKDFVSIKPISELLSSP